MAFNFGREVAYLGHDAAATATGTTGTVSGSIYDLTGYDSIVFFVEIGATATNNGLKALGGSATNAMSDLAGTFTTGHTTALMLEVKRPMGGRYVQPHLVLGTSAHHNGIFAFGVGPRSKPSSNSTLLTYKFVNSPASGTATSS